MIPLQTEVELSFLRRMDVGQEAESTDLEVAFMVMEGGCIWPGCPDQYPTLPSFLCLLDAGRSHSSGNDIGRLK